MKRNTKFKIINTVFIGVLSSIMYLVFFKTSDTPKTEIKKINQANETEFIKDSVSDALDEQPQEKITVEQSESSNQILAEQSKTKSISDENKQKILIFRNFNQKVLMTKTEKIQFKELLFDKNLIQDLGTTFHEFSKNDLIDNKDLQNDIYSFLLQSLQKGDHDTSLSVIKEIVFDKQIEDDSLPIEAKIFLGESKAELLYNASALYPDDFKNISSELPGPVTRKIWSNVLAMQKENEDLSRAEFIKLSSK